MPKSTTSPIALPKASPEGVRPVFKAYDRLPASQPSRTSEAVSDRRCLAATGKHIGARELCRRDLSSAQQVAGCVAGATVCRPLNQPFAAVPAVTFAGDRLGLRVELVKGAPQFYACALIERECHVRSARWRIHRWDGLKCRPEVSDILVRKIGIERIGERRIVRAHLLAKYLAAPQRRTAQPSNCRCLAQDGWSDLVSRTVPNGVSSSTPPASGAPPSGFVWQAMQPEARAR